MRITLFILTLCAAISCTNTETLSPEPQISFAQETKSHTYYVQQTELWWTEIEKDKSDENAWYNYYRACRNAQGTADWREDFVNESPNLRLGKDIVALMSTHIPETFTYHFVKGSTGGVDPQYGQHLLKAWEMNPKFNGIHGDMITLATSTHNDSLRKAVNLIWSELDQWNPALINYARDVLESVKPNAILFTQHDNDTYPLWLLQDAEVLRTDVEVVNIDFMLLEEFRKPYFDRWGIPPFKLDNIDVDEYRKNWKNAVEHVLGSYEGDRPMYMAQTVSDEWYPSFKEKMHLSGLAYVLTDKAQPIQTHVNFVENHIDLEEISMIYPDYSNQKNASIIRLNYLNILKPVYEYYASNGETEKAEGVLSAAQKIAHNGGIKAFEEDVKRWESDIN